MIGYMRELHLDTCIQRLFLRLAHTIQFRDWNRSCPMPRYNHSFELVIPDKVGVKTTSMNLLHGCLCACAQNNNIRMT